MMLLLFFYRSDWFRNNPMRAEFFDFEHGFWGFDWNAQLPEGKEAMMGPSAKAAFDKTDLLIIKELKEDATRQLLSGEREAENMGWTLIINQLRIIMPSTSFPRNYHAKRDN